MFSYQFESFRAINPTPISWQPWCNTRYGTAKVYPPPRASGYTDNSTLEHFNKLKEYISTGIITTYQQPTNTSKPISYNQNPLRNIYRTRLHTFYM